MIFRRMSEAIAKQDWFVVFIEVMVVVVGIFIGLQVDDWNESRKDKKDEQAFLQRLHGDVLLAGELSARLRDRRLTRLGDGIDALDVVFGRSERNTLNEDQCRALAFSDFFNFNAPSLSSVTELMGTGRMDIIRDSELRSELVVLEQTRTALTTLVFTQTTSVGNKAQPIVYPELIQIEGYFDMDDGEVRSRTKCDLAGMRANQAFLNGISISVDRYDAYIRDGLAPWSNQFDKVHKIVDDILGMVHETEPES